VAWGDYDNDGDLDILLTGFDPDGNSVAKLYRNNGGGFGDSGVALTGVGASSVAWGDYDNDGDLDILLTGYDGSGPVTKGLPQRRSCGRLRMELCDRRGRPHRRLLRQRGLGRL
jgi:hypothetical protein